MHEEPFLAGLRQVEKALSELSEKRVLEEREIQIYGDRGFFHGWDLPGLIQGHPYSLRLLIPKGLPFYPPRVAVWPAPKLLTWPHLEDLGLLCLKPDGASYGVEDLYSETLFLLSKARTLVLESLAGTNKGDFQVEFLSYWSRWGGTKLSFVTTCTLDGRHRYVAAWHGKQATIIADTEKDLREWIIARDGSLPGQFDVPHVPLLFGESIPLPSEYPETLNQARALFHGNPTASAILEDYLRKLVAKDGPRKTVLCAFKGETGFAVAGFRVRLDKGVSNGYRQAPPVSQFIARSGSSQVEAANVSRRDHAWVHGRDNDLSATTLRKKRGVIFGVGSLGSGVADLLDKAGVGHLDLVDPQAMSSENASRHALGINSTGKHKATELAEALQKRFPHLSIKGHNHTAEVFLTREAELVMSADIILSAIGSWPPEASLNARLNSSPLFPPTVFAWLEPHAAAAHAFAFFGKRGCLRCMLDDRGRSTLPITSWEGVSVLRRTPSCGGAFQPYGAAELSFAQGMVATLCLDVLLGSVTSAHHRAWVGRKSLLENNGGHWNSAWVARHGPLADGGQLVDPGFNPNPTCSVCAPSA